MRLVKLKLSGFKSFVDPTTIPMPSNLIGIVGPNGCGKSNTIDAVRWVMGEISAKHLRGDSMADVIFNGSNVRKPVGQASVELVFDNTDDKKLGGQYAHYNEIAIKRVVTRDGQSNYFLNNIKCRRRDITDIFLGTGLGPRSYAIIEQGMISRVIESKPEELRVFLEEAAGISKYKERRRETETRIRHTRENLDRLTDLRDEIEKRLTVLQRQAKTAERYKELKQEERQVSAEFQALKWRALDVEIKEKEKSIAEQETILQSVIAAQRHVEAEIEKCREQHTETNDKFNEVQARYYGIGGEIARVEQAIQHNKELRVNQDQDLQSLDKEMQELEFQVGSDQASLKELQIIMQDNEPALLSAKEKEGASTLAYNQAEEAMSHWQQEWDEFNQKSTEPAKSAEVERTKITHLENHVAQLIERTSRIQGEYKGLTSSELLQEVGAAEQECKQVESDLSEIQQQRTTVVDQVTACRENNHQLATDLHAARENVQNSRGRMASLEALQQAALGKSDGAVTNWLEQQGIADAPRLAQLLKSVDSGWEKAVETVLGQHLQAVCVDGFETISAVLGNLDQGTVNLFDTQASDGELPASNIARLSDKVTCDHDIAGLLGHVLVADNIAQALQLKGQLASHESIITADGIWLSKAWLKVSKDEDEKTGVIAREQEMKTLSLKIVEYELQMTTIAETLEASKTQLQQLEQQREEVQSAANQAHRRHSELQAILSRKQTKLEQNHDRQEKIKVEIVEIEQQVAAQEADVKGARNRLQIAMDQMEVITQQRETLSIQRGKLQEQLANTKLQSREDHDAAHELALKLESARAKLTSTEQSIQRLDLQLVSIKQRKENLQKAIAESEAPMQALADELSALLNTRIEVEKELTAARRAVEEIDHLLRKYDHERTSEEEKVQDVRQILEKKRMDWQGVQVRCQTVLEQVSETGFDLEKLLNELPEGANVTEWAESVASMEKKIQRLGAINLAAIDEYQEQSERKEYLDAQNADLIEALTTLENAIAKIDKETRTRFRETFDKVNEGVQRMFPRLFGGGHGYLELTGDDLLNSGVAVLARPPGKRLSSIHLMSGGEKALTAVALVFAIFELNPAPFCMLDEVDAPLDDANVARFCDLVKEMSERVQFIFITHNKVTMEMADYLTGVTMHEAGVSRMVAVDVEEAAKMAAS